MQLFQPARFQAQAQPWRARFLDAAGDAAEELRWDAAALLSLVSFNYACGDRTLLRQVRRQPWLAEVDGAGRLVQHSIPPHGRRWPPLERIAGDLVERLCTEAREACRDRSEIYVLTSGGLDSRIVAGVLAEVHRRGQLRARPVCVTWGLADSRDVHYGRLVAESVGFDWLHLDLRPEHVLENVELAARSRASLVSPVHLHRMGWFRTVSPDAVVLMGTFGDSVGRAEFTGHALLELGYLAPCNLHGLIRADLLPRAAAALEGDFAGLRRAGANVPRYVVCEREWQAHYVRGLVGHASAVIADHCHLHQMYTHRDVYSYMWSLHPSLRTDHVYAAVLERLSDRLKSLPWDRTNRALSGPTRGKARGLRRRFHDYAEWIAGPLYDRLRERVDPHWFGQTGIFDEQAVEKLGAGVRRTDYGRSTTGINAAATWSWLASVRALAEAIEGTGRCIRAADDPLDVRLDAPHPSVPRRPFGVVGGLLRNAGPVTRLLLKSRRYVLRRRALRLYPPERETTPT
jgi:hypothetical protein